MIATVFLAHVSYYYKKETIYQTRTSAVCSPAPNCTTDNLPLAPITGSTKILTTSQHETGLERVTMLEDRSRLTRSETLEEVTTQAPVFTTSLSSVSIKEGQRAHFESRLIPVSDPTMKVQWFHNGRPVKAGSR